MRKSILSVFGAVAAMALTMNANAQVVVLGEAPLDAVGSYTFETTGNWGADLLTTAITDTVVLYHAAAATDTLACAVASNAADLEGQIAMLYRGDCEFGVKALAAQNAGAVAVLMVNNVPGNPVPMGPGAVGAQVTIPVVMVSDVDGAFLRTFVDEGSLILFIGNKTGRFAYDAGFQKPDVAMAKSFATPVQFALNSADFDLPVGAWVTNYGDSAQTGVTLNATITLDGDELYNETSAAEAIAAGDSVLVSLPVFALSNYPVGLYSLTYTVATDSTDEFPNDNSRVVNFWINDQGLYSKSRIDAVTGEPLGGGGIRPADGVEYTWCTFLRSNNASAMKVDGVSFSTITNNDLDLTGEAVLVEVYEWNDIFDETTTTLTFDDINLVGEAFYDYTADLQSEFVTANFEEPVFLEDGLKYLVCATVFVEDMFITVDGAIDYELTYDAYPLDIFFPVRVDQGTWTPGGFGPDNAPAIITHLSLATGIADDVENSNLSPYPNPTADIISIPMGVEVKGNVTLNVFDLAGREVMSQNISNGASSTLRVDASSLSNGMHLFRLTFEDGTSTTFRAQINK
jgi:hypothetical protein